MLQHIRAEKARKAGAEGFTLIELLVVIVILGVLAAVVVIAVGQIRGRGEENACLTEAKSTKAAVALYFDDNDAFPANIAALVPTYLDETPEYAGDITINSTTGAVTNTCG